MPRSILLAEDSEDDVFFFKAAAKKAEWVHRITVAPTGNEVINILKRVVAGDAEFARLSLVLLDLKMPFVGGLEVLEWRRSQPALSWLPIVVFSSSEQESDIESAYRLGAASFLAKPANPETLTQLLRTINAYWLSANRLPPARLFSSATSHPLS